MSLQLVLGQSGSKASEKEYKKIIDESIKNPRTNYFIIVPEQYSMQIQKKMILLHPDNGTMNIDVIGFNRLTYRIFDELNYKPDKVLEDFGKSLVLRLAAANVKEEMTTYAGSLDKVGFIDEAKSLMSELYQYSISSDELEMAIDKLKDRNAVLYNKLSDMLLIFKEFNSKIEKNYIVAEQLMDLLAAKVMESKLIENSVILLDGFTGFTPIQINLIEKLLLRAKEVICTVTINEEYYNKEEVYEHELFYLVRQTIDKLRDVASANNIEIKQDIFEKETYLKGELKHLEENIFRYPYKKYNGEANDISINVYDNPRQELKNIAHQIKKLVNDEGYRYKDIAIITGNIESMDYYIDQVFNVFDIPFFMDYTKPLKNNPYINSIGYALRIVEDNFSFESVIAFVKSGVIDEWEDENIEKLENYLLKRGVRGFSWWNKTWDDETDELREEIIRVLTPFYEALKTKDLTINICQSAVRAFIDSLGFEKKLADRSEKCKNMGEVAESKLYGLIYDKLLILLDKLSEVLGEENTSLEMFIDLLDLGLKEITLGIIPTTLDMVTVGDITRTRLSDTKVMFLIEANDKIVPKSQSPSQIISDKEKELLSDLGVIMAPTNKTNSYIEQFYIYLNLTKATKKIFVSYVTMDASNENMRPSYIIDRIKKIFPTVKPLLISETSNLLVDNEKSSVETLVDGILRIVDGDAKNVNETIQLYNLYRGRDKNEVLKMIVDAITYRNIPESLSNDVAELLKARIMYQSVSKLETFAKCAYSYFLKYTIELNERQIKSIDNRDTGNILHSSMEKLYKYVHDEKNNGWDSIDDSEREELTDRFVTESFEKVYGELNSEEGKYEYLKKMLVRIGRRTSMMLSKITSEDSLKPEFFEHRFKKIIPLKDDFDMVINGTVDRSDIYVEESDNNVHLRVIDYKSGNNEFKLSNLYEGLDLQLSIYTNIMAELVGENYFNEKKNVVYDGMYYYRMYDPYIKSLENKLEAKRQNEMRLKGLKNDGTDKIDVAVRYSIEKAKDVALEILGGKLSKTPIKESARYDACTYCNYMDVCRFDTKDGGNKYGYVKYKENQSDIILEKMREKLGGE